MDKALDRSVPKTSGAGEGILVPRKNSDTMDLDGALNNKRKSRTSITKIDYKDDSDSDGAPLVSWPVAISLCPLLFITDKSAPGQATKIEEGCGV